MIRSGFKTADQFQGQGVPRIENGAYTLVREYFNSVGTTQPLDLLSALNHLSIRCEIPLHKAGRWGFETTSRGCFKLRG